MSISVIIPALNEAAAIRDTLESVHKQKGFGEIIVVDGGSTDGTHEIASRYARVLSSPPGRALQMNAGASAATGTILLFLHADTRLYPGHAEAIRNALRDDGVAGGCAPVTFDADHPLLSWFSRLSRINIRLFHYGDGGIFVRRSLFSAMGGFAALPIMEDLDFLRRMKPHGRRALLQVPVLTSARRFLHGGIFRTQCVNIMYVLLFLAGVSPARLRTWYPDIRS